MHPTNFIATTIGYNLPRRNVMFVTPTSKTIRVKYNFKCQPAT